MTHVHAQTVCLGTWVVPSIRTYCRDVSRVVEDGSDRSANIETTNEAMELGQWDHV